MLYIAQYRILIPFVTAFIFAYTLGYSHFVQAFSAPTMRYYLPSDTSEVRVDPLPYQHLDAEEVVTIDLTDYTTFPDPKSNGNYEGYRELISFVSATTGVNEKLLAAIIASESSFDTRATPGGNNTAKGLFQMTDDAWEYIVNKYGDYYNISIDTDRFNPKANAIMGALFIKDNSTRIFGKDVKPTEMYLTHFLGPTGAKRFMQQHPNKIAAKVFTRAAQSNKPIFYNNKRAKTFKEVYLTLDSRLKDKAREFNIN